MDHDPVCAICHQPSQVPCDCERKALDLAARQAEQRIMTSLYSDIRQWVLGKAQDFILEYYTTLTTRRREAHASHLHILHTHYSHYHMRPPPHEITQSEILLKQGIDADWAISVQRYPEVLEYFYSLVELRLPGDEEMCVRDPPLSALSGVAKGKRIAGVVEREEMERGRERERERRARRHAGSLVPPPPPPFALGFGAGPRGY